jgi:hypothetical protein
MPLCPFRFLGHAGSARLVFAVYRSWGEIIGGIPRVPRAHGSGPKSCERSGIRAIFFPCQVGGIARKISCTPPMARAQRTKALKILKSRTFLKGYGVVVKLKCRHPAKQKVGCGRTSARNGAELGSGHADIASHPIHFLLPNAFQFC